MNLGDIDPEFGTQRAESLMREYAYIAVQLDSLCYELEFTRLISGPSVSSNETDASNATSSETELDLSDKPIGINMDLFEKSNLDSLEKANRTDDPEINEIMRQFENMSRTGLKPFASTFIIPLLKKVKYDPRFV